jgi:hypothetical protein
VPEEATLYRTTSGPQSCDSRTEARTLRESLGRSPRHPLAPGYSATRRRTSGSLHPVLTGIRTNTKPAYRLQ